MSGRLIMRCAAGILLLVGVAHGGIIDDFQEGPFALGREGFSMPYTVSHKAMGSTSHIIGGQRDTTFEKQAGSTTNPHVGSVNGTGAWYGSGFGCRAVWRLEYGLDNDLNADLKADGADVICVDLGTGDMWSGPRPVPLTITVLSGKGTAFEASDNVTKSLVNVGTYAYSFADFSGVDFTDVDYLRFEFRCTTATQDAVDFTVSSFSTAGPEPATMSLVALGLGVAAFVGRRRRR